MSEDKESRTEAATPARLSKAIDENGVTTSRELGTLAGLGTALLVMITLIPSTASHFVHLLSEAFTQAGTVEVNAGIGRLVRQIVVGALEVIVPLAGAVSLAATMMSLLQTGFRMKTSALGVHFERLNPFSGMANLLGVQQLTMAAQTVIKLIAIGCALYLVLLARFDYLGHVLVAPPSALPGFIFVSIVAMLGASVLIQIAIAGADIAMVKRQFVTDTKMSHQDVKDEQKEMEGDPAVRARMKAARNMLAKRSLKAAMARAAVVITNPTHYAVALEYRSGQADAPKVVAKGADEQAARIRDLAREARIPIVANPPLARGLFRQELETGIEPEHYKAVAEVIAYIWKLAERQQMDR